MSRSRARRGLDLEPGRDLSPGGRTSRRDRPSRPSSVPFVLRERQDLRAPQVLQVQLAERHRLAAGTRLPRHRRHAEVGRQERLQVLLGDEAQVEQQPLEPLAALLLELPDLAQILRGDASLLEQELLEGTVLELHESARERISVRRCHWRGKSPSRRSSPVVEHARACRRSGIARRPARVGRGPRMAPHDALDVVRPAAAPDRSAPASGRARGCAAAR